MDQSFSERNNFISSIDNNEYNSGFRRAVITSFYNQYNPLENGELFGRLKNIMDFFGIEQSQELTDQMIFLHNKESTIRYFQNCPWNQLFDFAELALDSDESRKEKLAEKYNQLFRFNGCKYRIVNYKVIPVMSDIELEELKKASMTGIKEVDQAFNEAIDLLSNKVEPDYNAVIAKASNALEAMVLSVARNNSATADTLGRAITQMKNNGYDIDSDFEEVLRKTYKYACNAGIRHGGENPVSASEKDALFVLSVCASCINYMNS